MLAAFLGGIMGGADRRARRLQEREARKRGLQPPAPSAPPDGPASEARAPLHDRAADAQREATLTMLREGSTAEEIGENALGFAAMVPTKSLGMAKWACKRGCSFCCHQHVTLTAPEAVAIAAHLKATAPERVPAIVEKAKENASKAGAAGTSDAYMIARIPCVFLSDDGSCGIYSHRPIMCRGYHSISVESCRDMYDRPAVGEAILDMTALSATSGVLTGLLQAVTSEHLDGRTYEMHSAMGRALEVENSGARWRAGEDVFHGCTPGLL